MRIAIAVELDISDDACIDVLDLDYVQVSRMGAVMVPRECRMVRYEIHPDSSAIFAEPGW